MLPIDIKKTSGNQLTIIWDDGHESFFSMTKLRKQCPCASCKNTRGIQNHDPLKVLTSNKIVPENIQVRDAEIIGRYAVQFTWSDGHHEGIYSFDLLRELCECEACTNVNAK